MKGFLFQIIGIITCLSLVVACNDDDNVFVGFKIDKGYHDIKIEYRAPLKNVGLFISLIGFILFLLELRSDKKWKKSL